MKQSLFILFLLFNFTLSSLAQSYRTLQGRVKSGEKAIKNVIITDGENFTKTDESGKYELTTNGKHTFIYYTLPSGYESPIVDGLPIFFKHIQNDVDIYNFEINESKIPQQKHAFVVWADPQVMEIEEFELLDKVADDVIQTIENYDEVPIHAISCGDIVFDRLNLFHKYKEVLSKINLPFYQTIGNHDLNYSNQTHETSYKTYEENFGPTYYSFNKGNIHYIVMNDVFYYGYEYHYMGYFDQNQLDWLKQDLSYVNEGSTVVLTLHIPTMYLDANTNPNMEQKQKNSLINNSAFYNILKGYNIHILAGHSHTQWNTIINNSIHEHTHAAACAAWWQGEIGLDGTPKGYTVYEVDGNNLTWYFKGVGFSKKHQFKAYPIESDVDHPNCIIANVYNYDPRWKVLWYENDRLGGEMEQYWGVDPQAREIYQPGKNKKYSWLSFEKTNHLFKAIPKNKTSKITIEVTDRFGNKFTQSL